MQIPPRYQRYLDSRPASTVLDMLKCMSANSLFMRASSLSYTTILALGPIAFVAAWIISTVYGNDQSFSEQMLNSVLHFIAPQVSQVGSAPGATTAPVNPQLVSLLNEILSSAKSQAIGLTSVFALVMLIFHLFSAVEETLNHIWEVKLSRNLLSRFIWHIILLLAGSVLGVVSCALFFVGSALPFLHSLTSNFFPFLSFLIPAIAPLVSLGSLTLFYKFIPATRVKWKYAFTGAALALVSLYINNYFAFLYIDRFVLEANLFGSLGIIPVLLMSVYIFWLIILLGAQISKSLQTTTTALRGPSALPQP